MSPRYLETYDRNLGEYYAMLLFAITGMMLMAASRDLIAFYVGLELMAISSYLLAGYLRYQARSNEAALKYFVTGTFASGLTLYGISIVYGLSGSTNYQEVGQALMAAGNSTGLKVATRSGGRRAGLQGVDGALPHVDPRRVRGRAHPHRRLLLRRSEGRGLLRPLDDASSPSSRRSMDTWRVLFLVLCLITMITGNLFALVQKNLKRMLAYSSIAHVGYLLAGLTALGQGIDQLAGQAILLYLAAYTFMNLGAFGILAYLKAQEPEKFDYSLSDIAGLGRRSPWAAVLLALFMFSLTGIPGTAGFIGKFYLFNAVVRADLTWLAVDRRHLQRRVRLLLPAGGHVLVLPRAGGGVRDPRAHRRFHGRLPRALRGGRADHRHRAHGRLELRHQRLRQLLRVIGTPGPAAGVPKR